MEYDVDTSNEFMWGKLLIKSDFVHLLYTVETFVRTELNQVDISSTIFQFRWEISTNTSQYQ